LRTSADIKLPLRWIAILKDRVKADLAATSGVHTGEDAIKYLMVGANAVMMCSSLLKNGIYHLKTVLDQMQGWMEAKEYESVAQMQGSMSQSKIGNPESFERAQYMRAINIINLVTNINQMQKEAVSCKQPLFCIYFRFNNLF
jgi:dihydroorotate dehydrogenase (fumarate)